MTGVLSDCPDWGYEMPGFNPVKVQFTRCARPYNGNTGFALSDRGKQYWTNKRHRLKEHP